MYLYLTSNNSDNIIQVGTYLHTLCKIYSITVGTHLGTQVTAVQIYYQCSDVLVYLPKFYKNCIKICLAVSSGNRASNGQRGGFCLTLCRYKYHSVLPTGFDFQQSSLKLLKKHHFTLTSMLNCYLRYIFECISRAGVQRSWATTFQPNLSYRKHLQVICAGCGRR